MDSYFEAVVSVQGEVISADVVRSHGNETGDSLDLSRVTEYRSSGGRWYVITGVFEGNVHDRRRWKGDAGQ